MLLQLHHNSVALFVVFEVAAVLLHPCIDRGFSRVSKRWMTHVVCKCNALRQIFIQSQHAREVSADLCNAQCVRESCADVITHVARSEHLGLCLESQECITVDDAIAITLEREPRVIFGFVKYSAQSSVVWHCVGCKEEIGCANTVFKRDH